MEWSTGKYTLHIHIHLNTYTYTSLKRSMSWTLGINRIIVYQAKTIELYKKKKTKPSNHTPNKSTGKIKPPMALFLKIIIKSFFLCNHMPFDWSRSIWGYWSLPDSVLREPIHKKIQKDNLQKSSIAVLLCKNYNLDTTSTVLALPHPIHIIWREASYFSEPLYTKVLSGKKEDI